MYAWGLGFYGLAVYLPALLERHPGWTVTGVSTATTFYYLGGAALLWFVGTAFRRFGLRATVLGGLVALALGSAAIPRIDALWQLYLCYAAMALGWSCMSTTGIATILASRFDRRRGMALSLALNGASFAGVAVSPALLLATRGIGFEAAVPAVALAMALPLLPLLWLVLPSRAAAAGATAEAPLPRRAILARPLFWTIAAPFSLVLMAQVGFITHQVAILGPRLDTGGAALAVALTTSSAIVGRLGLGLVVDRLPKRPVSAACFLVQVAGLALLLQAEGATALYAACILVGINVGNVITLPALIVQEEFPPGAFAQVVGMVTAITQFAYAFGPGIVGAVRDLAGGYGPAVLLCIALDGTAALLVLLRLQRHRLDPGAVSERA